TGTPWQAIGSSLSRAPGAGARAGPCGPGSTTSTTAPTRPSSASRGRSARSGSGSVGSACDANPHRIGPLMEPRATGAETPAFVLIAAGLLFVFQFRLGVSLIAGLLAYTLLALVFRLIRGGRLSHGAAK